MTMTIPDCLDFRRVAETLAVAFHGLKYALLVETIVVFCITGRFLPRDANIENFFRLWIDVSFGICLRPR